LASFELGPKHLAQKKEAQAIAYGNILASPVPPSASSSTSAFTLTSAQCESLDQERIIFVAIGYGLSMVGSAGGIALPATTDTGGKIAEGSGVVVAGIGALIFNSLATQNAAKFSKYCTQ
jgi:hypothetical protein